MLGKDVFEFDMDVKGRDHAEELFEEGFRETGDATLDRVLWHLLEDACEAWEDAQCANDAVRGTVNATRAELGEYVSEVIAACEQMQACMNSVRVSLETEETYYQMTQADFVAGFLDRVTCELQALKADLRK